MFIVAICTTVIWNSNVNLSLVYHDTFGQYTEDRLNQISVYGYRNLRGMQEHPHPPVSAVNIYFLSNIIDLKREKI